METLDELIVAPTATTVPSLRAVTPLRVFPPEPGFGLAMMLQLVPSQCSESGSVPPPTAWMGPFFVWFESVLFASERAPNSGAQIDPSRAASRGVNGQNGYRY